MPPVSGDTGSTKTLASLVGNSARTSTSGAGKATTTTSVLSSKTATRSTRSRNTASAGAVRSRSTNSRHLPVFYPAQIQNPALGVIQCLDLIEDQVAVRPEIRVASANSKRIDERRVLRVVRQLRNRADEARQIRF